MIAPVSAGNLGRVPGLSVSSAGDGPFPWQRLDSHSAMRDTRCLCFLRAQDHASLRTDGFLECETCVRSGLLEFRTRVTVINVRED